MARYAFERAAARKRHLTSVDKANVLATRRSGGETVTALAREYPSVTLDHLYVDNAAMQIMLRPAQFDVILTGNLFGDILSDEAAALAGSIGLIPSLSRGRADQPALYEPIHGSAPTLAGKDVACPLGAIFSATLMLRESFGLEIEVAMDRSRRRSRARTRDIAPRTSRSRAAASCGGSEFTAQIARRNAARRRHSKRSGRRVADAPGCPVLQILQDARFSERPEMPARMSCSACFFGVNGKQKTMIRIDRRSTFRNSGRSREQS